MCVFVCVFCSLPCHHLWGVTGWHCVTLERWNTKTDSRFSHKEIFRAVVWCLTLSSASYSERKCSSLSAVVWDTWRMTSMLAEEVKRGGVLKHCNTADSHGQGLRDCFATSFIRCWTGHLGSLKPCGAVKLVVIVPWQSRISYVTDLLCCHHHFCRFASLCVSTLMWERLGGRKGTCELHLVLGKFRRVFLAFIKFALKQWLECSRWDASVKLWECKMSACK